MENLAADFIADTRDGLEAIDGELTRLRRRPDDRAALDEIRRAVRSLGETCRFLGLSRLRALAHPTDKALAALQDGRRPAAADTVETVLDAVVRIRALTMALCVIGHEPDGDDSPLILRLEALLAEDAGRGREAAGTAGARPDDPLASLGGGRLAIRRRLSRSLREGRGRMARRLLVIDHTPFARAMLQPLLARAGYGVVVARDPGAALALHDAGERFDLILADTADSRMARRMASALGRAVSWHATPLLSLALRDIEAHPESDLSEAGEGQHAAAQDGARRRSVKN